MELMTYQGAKKGKQVASSTKWGLGENVLRLVECLTPTDNYFSSFPLLNHLAINNIGATGVPNKDRLRKYTIIGDEQLQKKRNVAALNRTHQAESVTL